MPEILVAEHKQGLRVTAAGWEIEHLAAAGGAWSSIVLKNRSGRNLLRAPAGSALRVLSPAGGPAFSTFSELNEKSPRLWVEKAPGGGPAVVAEGTYRDENGQAVPVGYRRRTVYGDHGLIWTTLHIMSDSGCDSVVEVQALALPLRAGLTACVARLHPTQAGGPDLLGANARFDLQRDAGTAAFIARHTPLQMLCGEQHARGEGIDLFPGSELAEWDCGFKPDLGLGLYSVAANAEGTDILLAPYCMALRRAAARVQGNITVRLGVGLPVGPRAQARPAPHAACSLHTSADEIARLARAGVKVLRFQDSISTGARFWRNGAYPPYGEAGMGELKRVIEAAHKHELKIVAYVSLKELHPDTDAYRAHALQWMHAAAPSLSVIQNWTGSGTTGGLMCLKSGWLDCCKQYVDTILAALPWDGLDLDLPTHHPCCHKDHGRGPYHTDVDGVLDFLFHCRGRVGENGLLALRLNGARSIIAENIADIAS